MRQLAVKSWLIVAQIYRWFELQRVLRELVSIRDAYAYESSGTARTVGARRALNVLCFVIHRLALKLCLREAACLGNR